MSGTFEIDDQTRELRDFLVEHCDLLMASTLAETCANQHIERMNRLPIAQGTHMMATVLTANAMLRAVADWWAMGTDARATPERALAAMRSFMFELPDGLTGESYDMREKG